MVRRALTYQLILAVAVGPLLCCCSAGNALADTQASGSQPRGTLSQQTAVSSQPAVRHSCCSARKSSPPKTDTAGKSAPSKPEKPSGKCPCKEGGGKTQAAQAERAQSDLSGFLRALSLDTFLLSVFPAVVSEAALDASGWKAARAPGHAVSPTEELLYAHHNLRC